MVQEELLKPRYEVIADYPLSNKEIGEIVKGEVTFFISGISDADGRMSDYPHLFRKLHWWERRDIKDMPEYVKNTDDNKVYRILDKKFNNREFGHNDTELEQRTFLWWLKNFRKPLIPATLEEYTNYINPQPPTP